MRISFDFFGKSYSEELNSLLKLFTLTQIVELLCYLKDVNSFDLPLKTVKLLHQLLDLA